MILMMFKIYIFFYRSIYKFLALCLLFEDRTIQLMSAVHATMEFAIEVGILDLLDLYLPLHISPGLID